MPILPSEPDIFPANLLDETCDTLATGGSWWTLYTISRREKELVRRLASQDIACYGPLIPRRTRSPAGRVRTAYVPLFPGYVFLYGRELQRLKALETNCVSRCLAVPDPNELVHDLRQIQRLIRSGAPLTPEARLESGRSVRVRGGALAGLEGVVVSRRGQDRLLVAVKFLQQGASLSLADFQLEAID